MRWLVDECVDADLVALLRVLLSSDSVACCSVATPSLRKLDSAHVCSGRREAIVSAEGPISTIIVFKNGQHFGNDLLGRIVGVKCSPCVGCSHQPVMGVKTHSIPARQEIPRDAVPSP